MSPIMTLTIQTLTKENFNDICLKPKKLCKVDKLYNAKQFFKKNIGKKLETKF